MSYYGQGDYYAAGGLGSFLKKAVGTVARGTVGLLTGGPMGAAAAVAPGLLARGPSQALAPQQFPPQINLPGPFVMQSPIAIERSQRLSIDLPQIGGGDDGLPPRGYHLNKSGYFLRDGTYVAPRSRYVRNRSRNAANGRALNRAIGRVSAFNNAVKRSRKNLRKLASI